MTNSVAFTEEMKGFVTFGASGYDEGYRTGRDKGTDLMFHLTIAVDDIDRFLADDSRHARAEGWVQCAELGGKCEVTRGDFNLFVKSDVPGRRFMKYRLQFNDAHGSPMTLVGFKDVGDDPRFDVWRDTTTLYTQLIAGHLEEDSDEASPEAMGIITIHAADFAKQLTTFRGSPSAMAKFGREFVGQLWDTYGPSAASNRGNS